MFFPQIPQIYADILKNLRKSATSEGSIM